MKKIVLSAALCLLLLTSTHAQYHITGDTIQLHDSIWWHPQWFNNWVDNMPPNSLHMISPEEGGSFEVLVERTTDRPIRVIGIAACVIGMGESTWPEITDSMTGAQEYFYIYKSRLTGNEVPLRAVPWDPTAPHRYIYNRTIRSIPPKCDSLSYGYLYIEPLYEVYFEDQPLVLTDTFYIGISGFSDTLVEDGEDVLRARLCSRNRAGSSCGGTWTYETCVLTSYRGSWTMPAGIPCRASEIGYTYIFPILSQDTDFTYLDSCPAVNNIRLDTVGGASLLRWDSDSLNIQWQLSISDTAPDHATHLLDTLVDTNYLDLAAAGIAPPVAVQVRPRCLCYEYFDVWGNWGDCTQILPPLNQDTSTVDTNVIDTSIIDTSIIDTSIIDTSTIDTTWISSVVEQQTHLFPNPATGHVAISSSIPLRSIALYDPSGRCILRRRTEGQFLQLDLNGYANGSYHIVIDTPIGRTVKRLIIQ